MDRSLFQQDLERLVESKPLQQELGGDPLHCMAMIVMIDQFSRNIYRGTGAMFAHDALGLHWANHFLAQGWLTSIPSPMRPFAILPLEHHEGLAEQKRAMALFEEIIRIEPGDSVHTAFFRQGLDYAARHLKVIEQFGRFPHRNTLLGRQNTAAETEYLANGGENFA